MTLNLVLRSIRRVEHAGLFCLVLAGAAGPAGAAEVLPPKLEFIGSASIPAGFQYEGTEVGGLSGIDYDVADDMYYVISDDRSKINPARFYTLGIDLGDGRLDPGDITVRSVVTIRQPDESPFATDSVDPESIRFDPQTASLYWTSEGDSGGVLPPFVRQMTMSGTFLRELDLPQKFVPASGTRGVRKNFGFESLTVLPGSLRILTASENALVQDGPAASPTNASPARLLESTLADGSAKREFVYVTEPVASPPNPATASALAGLVELLAIDKSHYLALERSYATGVGHTIRLYVCSIIGATNVRRIDSIAGRSVQPVKKQLVADLASFGLTPGNVEGMTFGPRLGDGRRSLILIADNNFSTTESTQVFAFRYSQSRQR